MAKFFDVVGYGESVEIRPGVYEDVIVEKSYYGDVIRNSRLLQENQKVNDDLRLNNSISIVADAYADEHFHAVKYVRWAGAYWKVAEVTVQRPRLIFRLGGVYNGPKA